MASCGGWRAMVRSVAAVRSMAATAFLAGVASASPILEFDYSKDTGGFFAAQIGRAHV